MHPSILLFFELNQHNVSKEEISQKNTNSHTIEKIVPYEISIVSQPNIEMN